MKALWFFGCALISAVCTAQTLDWAIPFQAASYNTMETVATAGDGYIYTAGIFEGTIDLDPGPGTIPATSAGNRDILLARYDVSGTVQWVRAIGSSGLDNYPLIAIHPDGGVLVALRFLGTMDADPGTGTFPLSSAGSGDVALIHLNEAGQFVQAISLGGIAGSETPAGLAVANDGSIYFSGNYFGTVDFDPGPGSTTLTAPGVQEGYFILKLNDDLSFQWVRGFSGLSITDIATNPSNEIVAGGIFFSNVDFDPGPGTFTLSAGFNANGFLVRLAADGSFQWATNIGGSYNDSVQAMTVAGDGSIYATGSYEGTVDFDPGAGTFNLTGETTLSLGYGDLYVLRLNADGSFGWAVTVGVPGSLQIGYGLTTDPSGAVMATGLYDAAVDFDPGPGISTLSNYGIGDGFALILDNAGSFVWAGHIGGANTDFTNGSAWGDEGWYFTGGFSNFLDVDIDPTEGTIIVNQPSNGTDGLLVRLGTSPCSNAFSVETSSTTATCGDGTATAVPDGEGPYTFAWDDALLQETATATGLDPGTYSVTVTDPNGCSVTAMIEVASAADCPWDFDANGIVGVADLLQLTGAFGCTAGCCPYDLDSSGGVGVNDLLLFIANFGMVCE